jgi:hypothetical protein
MLKKEIIGLMNGIDPFKKSMRGVPPAHEKIQLMFALI